MKKYILISIEQIANMQKIKELQKTNKKGKNKAEIVKILNANYKINKELAAERLKTKLATKNKYEEAAFKKLISKK